MDKPAASLQQRKESLGEDSFAALSAANGEDASGEDLSSSTPSSNSSSSTSSQANASSVLTSSSRVIDRAVRTREHGRITLLLPSPSATDGDLASPENQCGWRSPHGEPFRPLGNPDLNLKLTPRLHREQGSIQSPTTRSQPHPTLSPAKDTGGGLRVPTSPAPPPVDVMSMFPRDLRKRGAEDREVKLAMRLQQSIAQYSPDKIQRLRIANHATLTRVDGAHPQSEEEGGEEDVQTTLLRLQQHHREPHSPTTSPLSSPRFHVEHGDASVLRLRGAIHEGSARLRLVRNGQSLLANVPTSEAVDFAALQRSYLAARHQFIIAQADAKLTFPTTLRHNKQSDSDDDNDGDGNPRHAGKGHHHSTQHPHNDAPLYLPYTTREPQSSPLKQLPTLAEFKAKAREERLPRRTLASSRAPMMSQSPRMSTFIPRQSRFILSDQGGQVLTSSPTTPPSLSLERRLTRRMSARRGSVSRTLGEQPSDPESDALARAMVMASTSPAASSSSSLSPHSVEKLQATLNSLEGAKASHANTLAKTLTVLGNDRRDCLITKTKNLTIDKDPLVDVERMRASAEAERVDIALTTLAKYHWYTELLKLLLFHREPQQPLHPAESFCVDVIRRIASEGHAFEWPQLSHLMLLLHTEDVSLPAVQCILTFLRRALRVHPQDWAEFFVGHPYVREPTDVFKQQDAKQREKRKLQRLTKLRTVLTINSVLRRIATPSTPLR